MQIRTGRFETQKKKRNIKVSEKKLEEREMIFEEFSEMIALRKTSEEKDDSEEKA